MSATGVVLALALAAIAAVVAFLAVPWRIKIAAQARGEPDGSWAVGGGAQLFACAATAAQARGTPLVIEVRALGRSVMRRMLPSGAPENKSPKKPEKQAPKRTARQSWDALARWVDPIDLAIFLFGERGRVGLRDVDASVRFGLRDVDLAGRIAGVLAVTSALVSPWGRLRHEVDWSGREHLDASFSLTVRFSPALIAWDTVRFAAKNLRIRKPAAAPRGNTTAPATSA